MTGGSAIRVMLGTLVGAAVGVGSTWALLGGAGRRDAATTLQGAEDALAESLAGREARVRAAEADLERRMQLFQETRRQSEVRIEACWQCEVERANFEEGLANVRAQIDVLSSRLADELKRKESP
ncbi:MAG: hypothetical protein IT385_23700 [Deltaproteobacteria bacterium]|nr:hypothetical protein [Deltaproteobacteria bacterium]